MAELTAQNCCDSAECRNEAQDFVTKISAVTLTLGEPPGDRDDTELALRRLKDQDKQTYIALMNSVDDYKAWSEAGDRRTLCFTELLPLEDQTTIAWLMRIISYRETVHFKSAEFCRGVGFRIEWGLGVADLGKASEGFATTLRALVSYTFAPTDPVARDGNVAKTAHCGGRLRLLAGVSQSYMDRVGLTSATLRAEIRLFDLAADLTSIGHVKLMVQGNAGLNRSANSIGVGAGLDVHYGGLHVMHSWQDGIANHFTELGLYYAF